MAVYCAYLRIGRAIIRDLRFNTASAVARFGDLLYLVKGRFATVATPSTPYDAVAFRLTRCGPVGPG